MSRLHFLKKATNEMLKSADWYDEQGLGDRFLTALTGTLRSVEKHPLHYQERFSKKFRYANVRDFPFVVTFKIKKDVVVINSVFHTSRNPEKFI